MALGSESPAVIVTPVRRGGRWRWGDRLMVLVSIGCAVLTVFRWLVLPGPGPAIQAWYPVTATLSGIVLGYWLLRRRWWWGALSLPAAAVAAVLGCSALQSNTVPAGPTDLTVLSVNTYYGQADPAALIEQVRAHRPQVMVLQEVDDATMERLGRAGLDALLPYSAGRADGPGWQGDTEVRSVHPLITLVTENNWDLSQPAVGFEHAGRAITMRAAHPQSPGLTRSGPWRSQLQVLGEWVAARRTDEPLMVVGDFNASSAHALFRRSFAGLTDAHAATGAGWVRTWPVGRRVPPFVQIDHVLVRGLDVVDAGLFTLPGTDHAGIWARVSLPG